jgi:hypothetical protein
VSSRRAALAGGVAGVVVLAAVVSLVVLGRGARRAGTVPSSRGPGPVPHALSGRAGSGLSWHAQPRIALPGTPIQQRGDQAFAQGFSKAGLQALARLAVPAPGIEGGWPALAEATTPEAWASAFTKGLLGIDFARQHRADLGHWLSAEEAPLALPGVSAQAADKVLVASVLDPGLAGGGASPIPSARAWAALAHDRVTWSVADLEVEVDPSWARLVASGWQPPDPRMTVEDVSGTLSTHEGDTTTTSRFRLALGVGTARWHPGYGTIAVGGYSESAP